MNENVTPLPQRQEMAPSVARQITDGIRNDADKLWVRLLGAYERGVHTALDYPSWQSYCKAEFGTKSSQAYRLLDAGRVARAIEAHSPIGESPRESTIRELVPVLHQKGEKAVAETWAEVVETHGPEATAAETRAVVNAENSSRKKRLTPQQRRFGNVLNSLELGAEYVAAVLARTTPDEQAALAKLLQVDDKTYAEWVRQVRVIDAASHRMRRLFIRGDTK